MVTKRRPPNKSDDQVLPHARSADLVTRSIEGELLVYDLKRHKAFCLNETAVKIWNLCNGKRTVTDLLSELRRENRSQIDPGVVWLGLDQLCKANLLKKAVPRPPSLRPLTRRGLVRAGALAATLPVIAMIAAPRPQAAASTISRALCKTFTKDACPG